MTQKERAAREARKKAGGPKKQEKSWRDLEPKKRLEHALIEGISEFVDQDVEDARQLCSKPLEVIEGPLKNQRRRRKRKVKKQEPMMTMKTEETHQGRRELFVIVLKRRTEK